MADVFDIRTGKKICETDALSRTFLYQIQQLMLKHVDVYVVHGPCKAREQRLLLNDVDNMGVPRVFERLLDEQFLIMEGEPTEWKVLMNG